MDLQIFPPRELDAVLRGLRNVAVSNDRFTEGERAYIEGIARIHGAELEAESLPPIATDAVAEIVVDPHRRKRALQLAIVMALVEPWPPSPKAEAAVRALADSFGIDEEGLEVLTEVTHGHGLSARFDMLRRVSRFIRQSPQFPGIFQMALPVLGIADTNRAMAARYRALASCAPGTFGRAVYDHFVNNEFAFPGERGGIPMPFHDVGHVLAGYNTDPEGEICQAAFQAGFARHDGFAFFLFGILQFHMGLRITPVARGYRGLFDVPRVLEALERGSACKADLSDGFDVFEHQDVPLDALRATLGIPPLRAPRL
jgi:hypothetical protein